MLAFERSAGQDLGFAGIGSGAFAVIGDGWNTIADAQQQIEDRLPGMKNAALAAEELTRAMSASSEYLGGTRDRVYELTEAQEAAVATQAELIGGIPGVFAAASAEIDAVFDKINTRILNSMPVLDIYTGAVKQSFGDWKKGQDQYQKDIIAIAALRQKLIDQDLPGAVLEAFDNSSMGLQALFTTLNSEDLAVAVAEMTESFGAAVTAGQTTFGQDKADAVAAATKLIQDEYIRMSEEAATAGTGVTDAFDTAFGEGAALWAENASTYVDELAGIVGKEIPGPLIGAPRFSSNVYTVTVNVTSTASSNPGKAVSQSLQASGMIP
jgi:hypothetical protein